MALETRPGRGWGLQLFGFLAIGFLILPSIIVVLMSLSDSAYLHFPPTEFSFRWYAALWDSPIWLRSSLVSLKIGLTCAVLATALGTMVALAAKQRGSGLSPFQNAFFATPLMVPGVVIGIAIFITFAPLGLIATFTGIVLAHTMLALPFVVLTMSAALRHFDLNQFNAAISLGAHPLRAFITVVLPQITGAMVASALFAFLTSFDEIVVTNFIGGGANTTLTQRMFNSLRQDLDPKIAAIGTTLTLLTVLILVVAVLVQGKSRIFEMFSGGKTDER